ncbi:hypothetical protein R3Q06_31680 [Rhodococcus erythropolis]|uniref:hypothetical protein n=1 Tax=Rhodococcus erythropolis TaxID=1833 RepID=UPI0029498538|nr:hypothetical protein [Rhodococcus erythropolis]MDV6278042.1 hypothetical protein [Rhodococcus erythropolis]
MSENRVRNRKSIAKSFAPKPNRAEGLAGLLPPAGGLQPRGTASQQTPDTAQPEINSAAPHPPAPKRVTDAPQPAGSAPEPPAQVRPMEPEAVTAPVAPPHAPPVVVEPAPAVTEAPPAQILEDENLPATDTSKVTVTAYLDRTTRDALVNRAAERRCDHADVAIEAFDAVGIERLRALFQPVAGRSSSGIPVHQEPFTVKGPVETWFRFTTAQRDWLDEQVKVVGSKSRSRLLAGVLSLHLRSPAR